MGRRKGDVIGARVRPLLTEPRLIVAVATIGSAQVFAAITLFLPGLLVRTKGGVSAVAQNQLAAGRFKSPLNFSTSVFPLVFRSDHLLAAMSVPLVLAGLM